ncbi:Ribonuclease toxin, BrnT, of type II toxin-antitoxin system [Candidatus Electrothrix aarhusensis]
MQYEWNPDKNAKLKKERNISFEEIIFHLSQGDLWKTSDHPDQKKYPGQRLYFVLIDEYIYIVPHVISKEHIVLKTIIPSRKATKLYRAERRGDDEIRQ